MEAFIISVLEQYGWIGFGIAVLLFLFVNPLSTSLIMKLFVFFSKHKDTSLAFRDKKFSLLNLTRPSEKRRIIIATIFNVVLFVLFFIAYNFIAINNLDNAAKLASSIGIYISAFALLSIWIKNKSTTLLVFEGNPDDLFRTYQWVLYDMNMLILSLDAQSRKIEAYLNGNELAIKIDCSNSMNTVTFTCIRDFWGMVLYSREFQRNIRKLINDIYYPNI